MAPGSTKVGLLLTTFAAHAEAATAPKTTVVVMRHCIRSTPDDGIYTLPGFEKFNEYSEQPWPEFPVEPMFCLPRGENIVEGQGRWLREHWSLPEPITAVADLIPHDKGQRDNTTMHALFRGLGLEALKKNTALDHSWFTHSNTTKCEKELPSLEERLRVGEKVLSENAAGPDVQRGQELVLKAVQFGKAGDWTKEVCNVTIPKGWHIPLPTGSCQAFSEFAERFLMELGGGMEMAWNRLEPADMFEALSAHTWYFNLAFRQPTLFKYNAASLTVNIARRLQAARGGTHFYVGHDSDLAMLNGALGVQWDMHPWPSNATTPGMMLVFEREGDKVSAQVLYVEDFGPGAPSLGGMKAAVTKFDGAAGEVHIDEFLRRAKEGSVEACANFEALPPEDPVVVV